jgi:hypothetical protein
LQPGASRAEDRNARITATSICAHAPDAARYARNREALFIVRDLPCVSGSIDVQLAPVQRLLPQ